MSCLKEELPTEYDVIVIGTGVPESIVAAAVSRIGKRVLHLDQRCNYGALWASHNLESIRRVLKDPFGNEGVAAEVVDAEGDFKLLSVNDDEELLPVYRRPVISGFEEVINVRDKLPDVVLPTEVGNVSVEAKEGDEKSSSDDRPPVEEAETIAEFEWTVAGLLAKSRKFNLDLAPRYLFSRGSLVELLISSNIARYAEFKAITRVLTWHNNALEQVPCSRADVFTTKHVNVVDKHSLMKLLQFCAEYDKQPEQYKDFENRPFRDFLRHRKVSDNVAFYVLHSIAMCEPDVLTPVGLRETQKFLKSLGRYGNSPFLCCLYGSGEIPQCFCRLCAVFGGIYHLCRGVSHLVRDKETKRITGVVSDGILFKCSNVVLEPTYTLEGDEPSDEKFERISRGIIIADESLQPTEREPITLLRVPANTVQGVAQSTLIQEMGPGVCVCPDKTYVFHLSARSVHSTPREDLDPVLNAVFSSNPNGKVLWKLYFNVLDIPAKLDEKSGIFMTSSPGLKLDYDCHIKEAEEIFRKMYSDEEFLPRAPDPEEILLDFDSEKLAEGSANENDIDNCIQRDSIPETSSAEMTQERVEVVEEMETAQPEAVIADIVQTEVVKVDVLQAEVTKAENMKSDVSKME